MNGPNNKILWCDFTVNPVKGDCKMACPYCYARALNKRFKRNPEIRFVPSTLMEPEDVSQGSAIFVGSTMELFGPWVKEDWLLQILHMTLRNPWHSFLFLTKLPYRMIGYTFPDNCWCGVTVTTISDLHRIAALEQVTCMHRFISFEPLHEQLGVHLNQHLSDKLDWLIVGAETGNRKGKITPEPEWIETILNEARGWHIPLFMKINLAPYWPDKLLQDSPNTLIRRSANPATRH